eukprot:gb/GECG01013588.1/.p1 GENE.gb/GECG01013588.1/~~gb/GECG01013588.1/.p1  ORF type:complete len:220 (+),score=22.47 gb/GECG01013588.1/:1-660(+)
MPTKSKKTLKGSSTPSGVVVDVVQEERRKQQERANHLADSLTNTVHHSSDEDTKGTQTGGRKTSASRARKGKESSRHVRSSSRVRKPSKTMEQAIADDISSSPRKTPQARTKTSSSKQRVNTRSHRTESPSRSRSVSRSSNRTLLSSRKKKSPSRSGAGAYGNTGNNSTTGKTRNGNVLAEPEITSPGLTFVLGVCAIILLLAYVSWSTSFAGRELSNR